MGSQNWFGRRNCRHVRLVSRWRATRSRARPDSDYQNAANVLIAFGRSKSMQRRRRRGRKLRPLATKVFIFTVTLMFWAVAVMFAYDLSTEHFDVSQAGLLGIVILLVAGAVAQFTS